MRAVAVLAMAAVLAAPALAYGDPTTDQASDDAAAAAAAAAAVQTVTQVTPTPAPVLIVRTYSTSASPLVIGQPFDLTLEVYNATGRRADNVVVSLGAAAAGAAAATGGLTVLDTGSAKYLGTLMGKKAGSISFRVIGNPGTTPGAIALPVTVSFEHENERKEVTYTIGLLLERKAAVSLVAAELPESVMEGETFNGSFEVANASAFALSGVTLSVEASGAVVTDGTLFLGAMDAASTESIDVSIAAESAGALEVTFVMTYLDDYGRTQTFRESRTVTVEAVSQPEPGEGEAETPDEGKKDNWFIAFIKALFGLGD